MLENNTITIANGEVTITYPTPTSTVLVQSVYLANVQARIVQLTNQNNSFNQSITNNNTIISTLQGVVTQLGG